MDPLGEIRTEFHDVFSSKKVRGKVETQGKAGSDPEVQQVAEHKVNNQHQQRRKAGTGTFFPAGTLCLLVGETILENLDNFLDGV